jgi:hypothetical protein
MSFTKRMEQPSLSLERGRSRGCWTIPTFKCKPHTTAAKTQAGTARTSTTSPMIRLRKSTSSHSFMPGLRFGFTEDGVFDEQTKELRTSALIPLEDGKRDEHVRNIYKLADTDSLINFHYSQYSDEPSERLQLIIKLRRSE